MSFVPTATAVLNYWVRILAALEKKINRQSYETWLKPTRFSHIEGKKLFVRIPSADFQHIGDRYADLIQEAIDNLGLDVESVTFTLQSRIRVHQRCAKMAGLHRCRAIARARHGRAGSAVGRYRGQRLSRRGLTGVRHRS